MAKPKRLYIQGTHQCNLRCVHCSHWKTVLIPTEQQMRDKFFIIDEFAELNDKGLVDICQHGEPLLAPEFKSMVEHCALRGLNVQTTTNGTLVDVAFAEWAASIPNFQIFVSLDSIHAATHDSQRGVKGTWDKAVNAIRLLKPVVSCIITEGLNQKEFEDFVLSLGATGVTFIPVQPRFGDSYVWWYPDKDPFYVKNKSADPIDCNKKDTTIVVDVENDIAFCLSPDKKVAQYTRGCLRSVWEADNRQKYNGCKRICSLGCP